METYGQYRTNTILTILDALEPDVAIRILNQLIELAGVFTYEDVLADIIALDNALTNPMRDTGSNPDLRSRHQQYHVIIRETYGELLCSAVKDCLM